MPEIISSFLGRVSIFRTCYCFQQSHRGTKNCAIYFNLTSKTHSPLLFQTNGRHYYGFVVHRCKCCSGFWCAGSRRATGRWSMWERRRSWSGRRGTLCWWASLTWRASTRSWPPPSRRSTTGVYTVIVTKNRANVSYIPGLDSSQMGKFGNTVDIHGRYTKKDTLHKDTLQFTHYYIIP